MFETFIVQPIFNVLAIIYALIPGHDFGIAVILFTILVRLAMWPLLRKQLHQSRLIRALQPEIKKIKEQAKGDKQREGQLLMELYRERGVNPVGSIFILFAQLPILIGLFQGLQRLTANTNTLVELTYGWVQNLGFMKDIVADIHNFDPSLLGLVDLTRPAFGNGTTYIPVLIIAILAGVFQYYQSKGMMPQSDDQRNLRQILKDEAGGKKAEQSEINAAVGRNMRYILPFATFFFASRFPGALALYWTTGSLVAIVQQKRVLSADVEEMERQPLKTTIHTSTSSSDKNSESSAETTPKPKKKTKRHSSKKTKKRR